MAGMMRGLLWKLHKTGVDMYEQYWKLDRIPFANTGDQDFFFRSHTHQAGLLKLQYVIENQHGAGVLVGGVGAGKTYLVTQLSQVMSESAGPFVHVVYPQMSAPEMLSFLAVELGAESADAEPAQVGLDRTLHAIERQLQEHFRQKRHPVIVVDEAHLIEDQGLLQSLQLLLNYRARPDIEFSLFLVGERSLLAKLQRMPQFDDRIAVRMMLRSLNIQETRDYIAHRLKTAGAQTAIFSPEAIEQVFEIARGVHRRINRLCDMALLIGFADGISLISADEVEAVAQEVAMAVPD